MRRHRFVLVIALVCCATAVLLAQQFRGQVVNRDGVGQRCQVDFYVGASRQFGVATDNQGYLFVETSRQGTYRVVVTQGPGRQQEFQVTIDRSGLRPSTLMVRW